MLASHVAVPLGCNTWVGGCATVLRAAGADVRRELPPQHHEQRHVACVVLVQRSAELTAAQQGLLRRARQRGVLVVSQDWLERCLTMQEAFPPEDFRFDGT